MEKIVLNGKIADIEMIDDNDYCIGIKNIREIKTFSGKDYVDESGGFPMSFEMENRIGWRDKYANIHFYTSNSPIDPETVEEEYIKEVMGLAETEYKHHYSGYTGYLSTTEEFKVGGHDILEILRSNYGEYIHMEIELFKRDELPEYIKEKIL